MNLEVGRLYRIRITSIVSVKEFYGFRMEDVRLLSSIHTCLSELFANTATEQFQAHESFAVGGKCVCRTKSLIGGGKIWRRVVVENRSVSPSTVICRQLDYGICSESNLADLRPLPNPTPFPLSFPPLAFRFELHDENVDDERLKNICALEVTLYCDFDVRVLEAKNSTGDPWTFAYVVSLHDIETGEKVFSSPKSSPRTRTRSLTSDSPSPPPPDEKRRRSASSGRQQIVYKASKKMQPPRRSASSSRPSRTRAFEENLAHLKSALKSSIGVNSSVANNQCGKCVVETIYSPENFYARFFDEQDDESFAKFKIELKNTLTTIKKTASRFANLRPWVTVGVVCLFESSEDGCVYRAKIYAMDDNVGRSKRDVHFLDTGVRIEVKLSELWPLLPEAFFGEILSVPPFVNKCSFQWSDGFGSIPTSFLDTKKILIELCRDKTFSYTVISKEGSTYVVHLYLPDVGESLSKILEAFLAAMYHVRPSTFACALTLLHDIRWEERGKNNATDIECVVPMIEKFDSLPREERMERISSFFNSIYYSDKPPTDSFSGGFAF